jgi:hypothetical protein
MSLETRTVFYSASGIGQSASKDLRLAVDSGSWLHARVIKAAGRAWNLAGQGSELSLGFALASQVAVEQDKVMTSPHSTLTCMSVAIVYLQYAQQLFGIDPVAAFMQQNAMVIAG